MCFLAALTYDQMAVVGCGLALLFCIACLAIVSNTRKPASDKSRAKSKTRSPIFSPKKPMLTP